MATTPEQQKVLAGLGYSGWQVSSVTANKSKTTDPATGKTVEAPDGNEQWVISDGKGHTDTMVVQPPAQVGDQINWPTDANGQPITPANNQNPTQYQIITPPKNLPAADTKPAAPTVQEFGGVKYEYHAEAPDGQRWQPINVAGNTPTKGQAAPSKPADWQTLTAPDGRPIDMFDPATGTHVAIPQDATDKTPDGTTKDTEGAGGAISHWVAKGGQWQFTGTTAAAGTPKEGDTYQAVESGRNVTKTYKGGQWVTTGVGGSAIPDAPKEGDTRPNVASGQTIQEVYRGGQWVTDPSVAPTPYGIPKYTYGEATPTSGPMQSVTDPTTGKQTFQPNPNTADPVARQQQLHDQAQAKHDDLQKQVLNGAIQPDEALQQWNDYWANTIEPQRQQLQRAQDQQTFANQLSANTDTRASQTLQQNQQNWNQDFASKAGDSAVKDMMDTLPYRVGPNMGADFSKGLQTLSSGGGAVSFSPGDFTFNMPDFENIRHMATAHALKEISPYAASQVGAPTPQVPQNVDYTSALNQTSYGGSFAPAPPAQPSVDPAAVVHAAVSAAVGNPYQSGTIPQFGPGNNP